MSAGHGKGGEHKLAPRDLDDFLDEALAHAKIKARLARPFKLKTNFDIALLGSSGIGGGNVYLDRHLKHDSWPYGVLPVAGNRLDVKLGLVRHERLEQACEDVFGWPYDLAHQVAQQWEERDYRQKGFDPAAVERAFEPFIKADAKEKIEKCPTDLDLRPEIAPPKDTAIIAHIKQCQNKEKTAHEKVGYVEKSRMANQSCGKCAMFIEEKYGGPACTLVRDPIISGGWCRRFRRGKLEDWSGDA